MADGADIHIRTDGLREFATAGPSVSFDQVKGHLTKAACTETALDGCVQFRQTDLRATDAVMKTMTQANQLMNGIRAGAAKIADTYEHTEGKVVAVLNDVAPHEQGLAEVSPELQNAQALNAAKPNGGN